jgi:hypothetical protein
MKIRVLAVLPLLLAGSPAFAGGVDGNWTGSVDSPNGPVQVSFSFKTDGTMLTGTTTGPDGNSIKLQNGKVDGDKITFVVEVSFNGNTLTFDYTGIVGSNEIKLHTDFMGQPIDYAIKKSL